MSCIKIDSTGQIADASTGMVIANLTDTSVLANGTILVDNAIVPSLQHELAKRHDYVLNCGDNGGPRYKRCSGSPYKYYCRKDGFLWNTGTDDPDCIDHCDCQKVYIKYCPLSSNKLVPCVGIPISEVAQPTDTISDLNQTTTLPSATSSSNDDTDSPTKRGVTLARQPEAEPVAREPAAVAGTALMKRHDYALDCSSASASIQKECKDFGYYCDSAGKVQAQYGRFVSCDIECECRALAKCLVTRWDVVCLKGKLVANTEAPGTFAGQVVNGTSVLLSNGTVMNNVKWE